MKLIVSDKELTESLEKAGNLIPDLKDKSLIKTNGSGLVGGDRGNNRDDEIIRKAALEVAEGRITQKQACEIYGISQPSMSNYMQGKKTGAGEVNEELRAEILDKKYKIENAAVTKLMDTLNLFNPERIEKDTDVVRAASQLANIVDKISSSDKNKGTNVQIVFYSPRQKEEKQYETITVG